MTDAREKATKKYEEAKIFKLLKKETQELKSNISNTNEQIPEPKILKLIQEINIKEPQKAIEKIIQIKNLIPEEFQKQKEKAQNQNIKNAKRTSITDMNIIVYGRAAGIYFYLVFINGNKFFLCS